MGRIQDALGKIQVQKGTAAKRSFLDKNERRAIPISKPPSSKGHESGIFRRLAQHFTPVDEKHLHERRVITASVRDDRAGPYRQLRTQLLKTMRDNNWSTLAITSAHESAGKSLTACNLAISLSKNVDTNVLLVDLDLETPTIHQVLNFEVDKGLVDYLQGNAELGEILFNPGFERLSVMASRPAGETSSELLAAPRMLHLIQDLCHRDPSNITIFDLPPLRRNDDAILFAPYADATLMVVEEGKTTKEQLQRSMQLLEKANVVGTILNKART